VAAGIIGTFTLAIDVAPTGDFAVSAPTGNSFPLSSQAPSRRWRDGCHHYNGATILKKAVVVTTLYASTTQINDGSAVQVGTASTKKVATLKPGIISRSTLRRSRIRRGGFLLSGVGCFAERYARQLRWSDRNADQRAGSVCRCRSDRGNAVKSTLVAGKNASAIFTIENIGNIASPASRRWM